jgi:hypothetical protein
VRRRELVLRNNGTWPSLDKAKPEAMYWPGARCWRRCRCFRAAGVADDRVVAIAGGDGVVAKGVPAASDGVVAVADRDAVPETRFETGAGAANNGGASIAALIYAGTGSWAALTIESRRAA